MFKRVELFRERPVALDAHTDVHIAARHNTSEHDSMGILYLVRIGIFHLILGFSQRDNRV